MRVNNIKEIQFYKGIWHVNAIIIMIIFMKLFN